MAVTQTISNFPDAPQSSDTPEIFNNKADAFILHQDTVFVDEVNVLAGQINTTATAVSASETAAATSATSASNSATAANTSANNSANSAVSSATSATNSQSSATASATSATASATSATNASASASNASTSAAASQSSATAAAASETGVALSATQAANSATASQTSADSSAASAVASSNSATASGVSATNATTASEIAIASANYKGDWSIGSVDYPYAQSISVSHGTGIWISKVNNNTEEPIAVSANWETLVFTPTTNTPTLSGVASADENTDVVVTITNYDATATYNITVDYGTVVNNNDGTITVSLPDYSIATNVNLSVSANKAGENTSAVAVHAISVVELIVDTPLLSGNTSVDENDNLIVTITNYDATVTYVPTMNFGTVVDNGDGTLTVTAPDYQVSNTATLSVYATKLNYTNSVTATHIMSVLEKIVATPVVTGVTTADENTNVVLTVTNYDATVTYVPSVNFGSVVDNANGTFTVSIPDYDISTSNTFSLYATKAGETTSATVNHVISVLEVLTPKVITPIITGNITGVEESTVVLTVTNYDGINNTYFPSVNFGSVVDNTDGTFTVTLPNYSVATSVSFSLYATRTDYLNSNTATHNVAVTNTVIATPTLSSNGTVPEETTILVTITNYDATVTYVPSVNFGSFVDNGNGTITVTAPLFATSNSVTLSVYATKIGDVTSGTATEVISVTEVSFVADTAVTDTLTTSVINDGYDII